MPEEEAQLLKLGEAAKALGVSERTIEKHVHDRSIGTVRIGKSLRFEPEQLAMFIEEHRVPATPSNDAPSCDDEQALGREVGGAR